MSLISHASWATCRTKTTVEYQLSNNERFRIASTDLKLVMAEQSTHDVVTQARSVGDPSPSDVSALKPNDTNAGGDLERTTALTNTHNTSSSEPDKDGDVGVADVDPRLNGTGSGDVAPEIEIVSLDGTSCSYSC